MTDIDPSLRKVLYLLAWIVGTLSGGLTAVWGAVAAASPDVAMPLWLVITSAALTFLAAQLNLVARANVPSLQDAVEGDADPDDVAAAVRRGHRNRGAVDVLTVLVVAVLVVLLIVLLRFVL